MTMTVNVHFAKDHLSSLLNRAYEGEEIVLAKAGKPYAVLGPLPPSLSARRPGRLADQHVGPEIFDPLPPDEFGAWEGR